MAKELDASGAPSSRSGLFCKHSPLGRRESSRRTHPQRTSSLARFMEPLKSPLGLPLGLTAHKVATTLLLTLYSFFVLIPLLKGLARYSLDFSIDFLSPAFLEVLLRSVFFSLAQATVSVLLLALFIFSFSALHLDNPLSARAQKFFSSVGLLTFSLSPTLVALSLLMLGASLFQSRTRGFWAIVLCHFLLNFAFFASLFYSRFARFLSSQGKELSLLLKSLGAPQTRVLKELLWPVFLADFKSWAPQVFLWCFTSFAPIILLSSGNAQSTPEVLLYYSLLNDPSGTRLLLIFLLTAALSLIINFFASRAPARHEERAAPMPNNLRGKKNLLLYSLSTLLLLPFLYSLFSPLFYFKNATIPSQLFSGLQATLLVFLLSFLFSFAVGILSLLCKKEIKLLSYSNFISAPMILLGFLEFSSSLGNQESNTLPYVLIAWGGLLAVLPWFHRQIQSQLKQTPPELPLLCASLGMNTFQYLKNFLWPQCSATLIKLCLLLSLWSLGEYSFSKALLNRSSTLALYVDEELRNYHFAEAAFGISLTLVLSLVVVIALLWNGKKQKGSPCAQV